MQWDDRVAASIFAPGETNVTDYADEPSSRDKRGEAPVPYLVEFIQKFPVICDVPHLSRVTSILLEGPIGRRSQDQVNAFRSDREGCSSVRELQHVVRRNFLDGYLPVQRVNRFSGRRHTGQRLAQPSVGF